MPTRRPLDTLRPGSFPDLCYGLGRDYAVPMMTRRAFSQFGDILLAGRETLPYRVDPVGISGSRRPPC